MAERTRLAEEVYLSLVRDVAEFSGMTIENDPGPYSTSPALSGGCQQITNNLLLRHPAIWEVFIHLPRDKQEPFLRGDLAACRMVASKYVERILDKATKRQVALTRNIISLSFCKLAMASRHQGSASLSQKLWNSVLCAELQVGITAALQLYDEAYSSGIIEIDYDKWRWRYPFVEEYLSTQERIL